MLLTVSLRNLGSFLRGERFEISSRSNNLFGGSTIKLYPRITTTITGVMNDVRTVAERGEQLKGVTAMGENPGGINILRSPKWKEIQLTTQIGTGALFVASVGRHSTRESATVSLFSSFFDFGFCSHLYFAGFIRRKKHPSYPAYSKLREFTLSRLIS